MTDRRIVVDLANEDVVEDMAGILLQHVGQGDKCMCGVEFKMPFLPQPHDYRPVAQHMRDVMIEQMKLDAEDACDLQADALVDAAEVIKLRIEKKIKPMMEVEARVGMAGYMANRIRAGGRAMMALTIENIMYRWLIARSEAVRSGGS